MTNFYGEIILNKKLWIRYSVFAVLAAFFTFLDQWSKVWMVEKAGGVVGKSFEVIKGILNFTYIQNKGASMGILGGQRTLLIIVTVVIIGAGLWYFIKYKPDNFLLLTSSALILSGAVGNLIDRVALGYVRDFIDVQFVKFYVFNVADCGIVIGAGLLMLYAFLNIED